MKRLLTFLAFTASIALPLQSFAEGWLDPLIEGRTEIHTGLDKRTLATRIIDLKERGRIAIDVETYQKKECRTLQKTVYDCRRYALVSAPNPDRLLWEIVHPYDQDAFSKRWDEFVGRKFRLADFEHDGWRYSSITALFVQNQQDLKWASFSRLSQSRFNTEYKKFVTDGQMTMIDHEVYDSGDVKRHAVIFAADAPRRHTPAFRALSKSEYAKLSVVAYDTDSLRPLYMNPTGGMFFTTFIRDRGTSAKVFTTMTRVQFNRRNSNLKSLGYRLVDVEIGAPHMGSRWQATWLKSKNPARTNN